MTNVCAVRSFCFQFALNNLESDRLGELADAILADQFALEVGNVVGISAEDAGRFILFENDLVLVYKNFNGVLAVDIHGVTNFNRENDTTKFIDLAYNSG